MSLYNNKLMTCALAFLLCGMVPGCVQRRLSKNTGLSEIKDSNEINKDAITKVAIELYPNDSFAQKLFGDIVSVVKNHKRNDPFLGGNAPGFPGFGMHKFPVGFYFNTDQRTTDVLIVNTEAFTNRLEGFEENKAWQESLGIPIAVFRKLTLSSLAPRLGIDGSIATATMNYIFAVESPEKNIFGQVIIRNKEYLPKTHPIRMALARCVMPLIGPFQDWALGSAALTKEATETYGTNLISEVVHETFHQHDAHEAIKSGELFATAKWSEAASSALKSAVNDDRFARLIYSYFLKGAAVLKLSQSKMESNVWEAEKIQREMRFIKTLVQVLRKEFPEAFQAYIHEEYAEGFAEYSAAETMVYMNFKTFEDKIASEIDDESNAIFYRSGTLGGMFMRATIGTLPWAAKRDLGYDAKGIWEKLLESLYPQLQAASEADVETFLKGIDPDKLKGEMDLIVDYFAPALQEHVELPPI